MEEIKSNSEKILFDSEVREAIALSAAPMNVSSLANNLAAVRNVIRQNIMLFDI